MAGKVTDPELLAQLEAAPTGKVTDPALLAQLEQAPAPAPKPGTSPTRWSQKLGEGMAPGFNRLVAAAQAATDPLIPGRKDEWGQDFGTRYSEHLRSEQGQSSRTQTEHPLVSAGLQTTGAIPTAIAMGAPSGPLRSAAGGGAMYGAGDTRAQTPSGQLLDTFIGGAAGAGASLLPRGMLATENAARRGVTGLLPRVTPTPAAQTLLREGVPLTIGQMAGPDTAIGQFESVSANNPLGQAGARQAAERSFMRVAQNKGAAPGTKIPESTDLQSRASELLKGFGPVYDEIGRVPASPGALESALDAASMPRRGVDARTAAGVKAEVQNALTVLGPEPQAPKPSGLLDASGRPIPAPRAEPRTGTVGDLLKVRENIRQATREARQAQDHDKLRLLGGAEDVVTDAIEKSLPADKAALLRDTDRQYARLMTSLNAAPAGQTEFTPGQYLRQVEKGSGRRAFKTGGAGDLQDLGESARQVFVNAPLTGHRGAVLNTIPWGHKLAGPFAAWANTPTGRAMLLRGDVTLPAPPAVPPASSSDVPSLIEALTEAMRGRIGAQVAPARAKDDRPR